jgi:hypothetical protein
MCRPQRARRRRQVHRAFREDGQVGFNASRDLGRAQLRFIVHRNRAAGVGADRISADDWRERRGTQIRNRHVRDGRVGILQQIVHVQPLVRGAFGEVPGLRRAVGRGFGVAAVSRSANTAPCLCAFDGERAVGFDHGRKRLVGKESRGSRASPAWSRSRTSPRPRGSGPDSTSQRRSRRGNAPRRTSTRHSG